MTNPAHQLADAIRDVTAAVQKAIDDGHRSRMIDADDLVEVLLSIADRLDPPIREQDESLGRFQSCQSCSSCQNSL